MYVSICSEGQASLQAIQDAKAMSPLVQQCQKALNVSSLANSGTVSGSCTYWGKNKRITNKLATDGSVQKFVGPEPSLGVSMQNIKRKIKS